MLHPFARLVEMGAQELVLGLLNLGDGVVRYSDTTQSRVLAIISDSDVPQCLYTKLISNVFHVLHLPIFPFNCPVVDYYFRFSFCLLLAENRCIVVKLNPAKNGDPG